MAVAAGSATSASAAAPVRLFSPDSVWNAPVPANASLDPDSAAIVSNLLAQEATSAVGIATTSYGVPIYTVGPDQPPVKVTLLQGPSSAPLQAAFDAVPIPPGAQPAPGNDANMVVYQPSTNSMWEFWHMAHGPGGWTAVWGGHMDDVSSNPGYYRYVLSPTGQILEQPWWGAPASSLALAGGVVTIADLQSGQIDHALALGIPQTAAGRWAWPAQRTDGQSTASNAVPEGAHFRLDPNLNLASLNLPPFVLKLAQAAQRYGIIINNRSFGFTFRAEDPTQFEQQYGYNPYMGPQGRYGSPGSLIDNWPTIELRQFPWSHLQLLQMNIQTQRDMTPVVEP